MKFTYSAHGMYLAEYHIVWIPKYRRRILNPGVAAYIRKTLPKVLGSMPGTALIKGNIQIDHIHAVMTIPPKYSVADVVSHIKGTTASLLRKKFDWLEEVYRKENIIWSPGYFVSTVGINESIILRCIEFQQRQDSGQLEFDL